MKLSEKFGRNLKIMLKDKGLTNLEFAKMIGVTDSCISKWIYAQREPTLTNIYNITKVLECSFDELVD